MKAPKHVSYPIGFTNSKVLSYQLEGIDLIVYLKAWNEKVLRFKFVDCLLCVSLNPGDISNICEVETSHLFELALAREFSKVPLDHGYKLYHFLDLYNFSVIEVGCAEMLITACDNEEEVARLAT